MDVDLSFAAHGNGYVLIEWQILNHQEAVGHEGNGGTRQATKLLQVLRELDTNQKFIQFCLRQLPDDVSRCPYSLHENVDFQTFLWARCLSWIGR